ncbi:MAG TPA: polyhydroxyalkanoate synthesis protein PhaF [Kribbellaceae bacterium]|nr:polyhydroxyalkanoate synthesis protein PhaF [Kribbellaceae bacterium]
MVKDALRGYVQLANGLSEVTRQRAQQTAKQLLHQTGTENLTTGLTNRVSVLADEIIATSKSNRALLQAIITNEVEGAVARLGFVRAEEVAALRRRLEKLEQQVGTGARAPAAKKAAKKTTAKKATAETAAKTTVGETAAKTTAGETAAKTTAGETAGEEG